MSESKELMCINALELLLKAHFSEDEYCLNGPKESAICLEKNNSNWIVYDKERNSRNNEVSFSNVVEACLEMIERMFLSKSDESKTEFLESIVVSKIA